MPRCFMARALQRHSGMGFKNILCAIDFSPAARQALAVAKELAGPTGKIALAHVLDRDRIAKDVAEIQDASRFIDQIVRQAELELEAWRAEVAPGVVAADAHAFSFGRPWEQVVELAGRIEADLVVVGAGARHHGLLGSTAQRIVRHAPCSVLATSGVAR